MTSCCSNNSLTILIRLLLHMSHITYAQLICPTYAHQHSVHNAEHEDTEDMHPRPNGHDVTCVKDIWDMSNMCPKTTNTFHNKFT